MRQQPFSTVPLLGWQLSSISWSQLTSWLRQSMTGSEQWVLATLNPEMVVQATHDPVFRAALEQSVLVPDGMGTVFGCAFWSGRWVHRLPGVEVVERIVGVARETGQAVYLLGGLGGVGEAAAAALRRRFPGVVITTGGDNVAATDPRLVADVHAHSPAVVLVAFGHGTQERWIRDHLAQLPSVRLAMGVGGTFDFLSGQVRRAPGMMRALGLEWLWRLLVQPWRWRRIWTAVCVFPLLVVRSKWFGVRGR